MVKKALSLLRREWNGLHDAALLLAATSLASQFFGLFRDRLLAGTFGAGVKLDIYYAAFRLPDILYALFASFVSVTVIVPMLSRQFEASGQLAAKRFLDSLASAYTLAMIVGSLLALFFLPKIIYLVAPGFSAEAAQELVNLTRIMLLSPFLLGLSNLAGGIAQTFKRFFYYALSPVFYNIGIIVGIVIFYPLFGLKGLAFGVVLGALLHLAIQLPALWQIKLIPRPTALLQITAIKEVVRISLPRTLALTLQQLVLLGLLALASHAATGGIAVFVLASNLQAVPLAILGASYSVAAFPTLARHFSGGNNRAFVHHFTEAWRHLLFWSLMAAVMFIVLRAQIVRVILGAGEFGWTETRLVAAAFALFSVSLPWQNLTLLLSRGYYAAGRTAPPLLASSIAASFSIFLALTLKHFFLTQPFLGDFMKSLFRLEGVAAAEILVFPIAFSGGAILNCLLLWLMFRRRFGSLPDPARRSLGISLAAALAAGLATYAALNILDTVFNLNKFWGVFGQGMVSGLLGLLVWLGSLWFLRSRELGEIAASLGHKFWKTETVLPDQETL